jgi:hypothetical protein
MKLFHFAGKRIGIKSCQILKMNLEDTTKKRNGNTSQDELLGRLLHAVNFATIKHKKQRRKGNNDPYINVT